MKRITTLFNNIIYLTKIDLTKREKIIVNGADIEKYIKSSSVNSSLKI